MQLQALNRWCATTKLYGTREIIIEKSERRGKAKAKFIENQDRHTAENPDITLRRSHKLVRKKEGYTRPEQVVLR